MQYRIGKSNPNSKSTKKSSVEHTTIKYDTIILYGSTCRENGARVSVLVLLHGVFVVLAARRNTPGRQRGSSF